MQAFELPLNSSPARIMHIDINSCFATIEQQANPALRGKPVAVMANPAKPFGVVLAASVEAKRLGVKTGMRFRDAYALSPELVQVSPDANKYRAVHLAMKQILEEYSEEVFPKSIDEFVVNLAHAPRLRIKTTKEIAQEIKDRIREEIGEWISVSVGIGTNRFFAKVAAGLVKPDGLVLMDARNARQIYAKLDLVDLHGINVGYRRRLNSVGIYTPIAFLEAGIGTLKAAFQSVGASYWYTRLRGYEIDSVEFSRKSFGNTYTMPEARTALPSLAPILAKLTTKASQRLRRKGYKARGVHVSARYDGGGYWHKGHVTNKYLFDTREIYKIAFSLLAQSPRRPIRNLAVTCFDITEDKDLQLEMFEKTLKNKAVTKAMDEVNEKWGDYTLTPARVALGRMEVPDVVGFGNVRELHT